MMKWCCNRLHLLLLVAIVALLPTVAPWKRCDDVKFCRRIRNDENPGHRHYHEVTKVGVGEGGVYADLKDTRTGRMLVLRVAALKNATFWVQIFDPTEKRHNATNEALKGEPELNLDATVDVGSVDVRIENGESKATIHLKPFLINVHSKYLGITLNEGGRFTFNTDPDDPSIAMDIKFGGATRAYGIPEHGERLSLKSSRVGGRDPYRLFNVDYCCYALETPDSLYGSVPVIYGHGTAHTGGAFWLNSAQTFVDVNYDGGDVNALFMSESGIVDLFVFPGPTLQAAVRQYGILTGTAPLPQIFSLAYHQSRYSYFTQTDLESVVKRLDDADFPVDVLWLDIDYTDARKYFTWNYTAFPQPDKMIAKLDDQGRQLVVIIDPHIKVEKGYRVYEEALENGYFVRNVNGSVFEGDCWPGLSSYIDFTNPHALDWYSSLYSYAKFPHAASNVYIWNDMNEPSVFNSDENTMPSNDVLHYGNAKHRDVHNLYGFKQTEGTFRGLLERSDYKRRPFILTRSHFAGSQRYSAIWTGDNVASWEHLRISIPMCLTEALAGISFCGADVGGFVENPDEELLIRWYQLGAWLPFFRAHSDIKSTRREPYLYPAKTQAIFRKAIKQRYATLPTWYTIWYEHEKLGDPVIRPLTYHYSDDAKTLDIDTEFMVGRDILVIPILEKNQNILEAYVPEGDWYEPERQLLFRGGHTHPVQVNSSDPPVVLHRAGSILFRKDKSRNSTAHMIDDPITLYVFTDERGEASGNLYFDDFVGYEYRNSDTYFYARFTYKNGSLAQHKIDAQSSFPKPAIIDKMFVYSIPTGKSTNNSKEQLVSVREIKVNSKISM